VASAAAAEQVVRRPERVERARPAGVEPKPRLPLAAPVQQAHRPRVKLPALPRDVVAAEPVLVPPVLHGLHLAGEHQEERRERPQLVYPGLLLLDLHPVLQLHGVPAGSPPVQVDDHDAGVEVARRAPPVGEDGGVLGVTPERVGEVGGEVGVAILGGGEGGVGAEVGGPEAGDVVDDEEVGVEVEDAGHRAREEVGEVDARVIEGLVEGAADGGGDLAADKARVEAVDGRRERGERRREGPPERREAARGGRRGGDEVEGDGLRAGGVAEHGEDAGEGAPEVGGVQRHGDVDPWQWSTGGEVVGERGSDVLRRESTAVERW
ncbi:Os04g0530801, partial [Oryza sativa Japonica Group]